MNFQFYLEKLQTSEKYKEFIKKNPEAYFCSGFFVIDKSEKDNKQHFDFFDEKKNKIFSFETENNFNLNELENLSDKKLNKISFKLDFDFNEVEKLIETKIEKEGIKNKIQKFLFSLQRKDNKNYLIGTVFISMMGMLKVNINLDAMKITDFEKKSFMDVLKVSRGKK